MNKTKWLEINKTFWGLETSDLPEEYGLVIPWMTCTTDSFVYGWDETWSHFWSHEYTGREIEWLKIKLTPENRKTIKCALLLECRELECAVNLLPFGKKITAENIVKNIIYLGLVKRIEFLDKE